MNADIDALVTLLIADPAGLRAQVRMTGKSEAALVRLVALRLDELEFCQWWDARHVGGVQAPNPNVRNWASRRQLTEKSIEAFYRNDATSSAVAELLFEIPGITHLSVTPYSLQVEKSAAFGWDEIAPRVTGIIAGLNAAEQEAGG